MPDVTCEQGKVDERKDVVDSVMVFGYAERPADLGAFCGGKGVSKGTNESGRNACDRLSSLQCPRLYARLVLLKTDAGVLDKVVVSQPCVDDLAGDGVGEGDVCADFERKPAVCPLCRRRVARIDDEQFRAVVNRLENVVEVDRVRLSRIGTPQDDEVCLFRLSIGAGSASCPEYCRQTDDAGGVSSAVAAVDVVCAHDLPCEFLRGKVDLVGGF